jgi:PAS domain S-box-containing protein
VTRGQRRRRHGLSGEKARIEVGVFYTADANGQPTWFSANVAPLLGDGAEQWIASPAQFIERIHAADRTRFQARLENTLPGEPRACLFRWLDATNQYRTIVDQAVRLPGPDSSAQTIVGRFRPASLPQLPATGPLGLLDQSPDGVVVLDGECRIRHWSAGAEQLFGWSADEVVNRDAASIFGDSHSIVWENALHLTQETGHWRGEMSLAHRNGDRRTIDSRWCQTFVEGHADGYMLFLTDVTESRKHEAQTRSSRRLVEMADLIRGISHDLNNVLTPLMTGLDLLKMAGVADETRQEIITAMAADAARGAQLVKAIRTLCTPSHKVAPGEDVVEPRPTNGRHRPPSEGIDSVNTIYPSGKGTCILLVDDEVSVRVLTRLTLEAYGFRILMASDGVEATTAFARHQDAIRLALVDLIMPIWDGVETIRRLRGLNPVLPVVMMSGDADASARVSGIAACQVLYKPFTALDLMKTVSAALGLACGVGA